MDWPEVFAAFVVCHLVGDYLLQTDWQARNKRGGLARGERARESRRALLSHAVVYTLAFVPVLVALAGSIGAWTIGVAALILVPHAIQDDGRALTAYIRRVKGADSATMESIFTSVDQSFHVLALFLLALLAGT